VLDVADNGATYAEGGVGTATLELLESATRYNRWIVDFIRPRLGETNIELGAGRGTLSEIVGETHNVLPFELSEHNQQFLAQRFAAHPRVERCRADLLEHTEWGSADCVYSANVLEHIRDDRAILQHSARLLKPGGWFVAFVPAGTWLYSSFDRALGHCRRYGQSDRQRFARIVNGDAQLVLREFRYVNAVGALGWFLKMRLLGQTSVSLEETMLMERLLPMVRILDWLGMPFGQSAVMALERIRT
jgi:SAM-dependent methyltransferase